MSDLSKLRGRLVIASVSGGKDSAALSLWLTENGIEHRRVFADTGNEYKGTYEYLRGPLTAKLGPIDEVRGPKLMDDLIRHKGAFPSRLHRFCTVELKVKPLAKYVRAAQDEHGEVVNAVGIRAAESKARSGMAEWEWLKEFDCDVWRPLIGWTKQDVIDIHQRHGLVPNSLYFEGVDRVGCWPCIHSRKEEIRLVAKLSPERIEEIAALEIEVSAMARARADRDGTHAEFVHGFDRTFFQGRNSRQNIPVPIAEAVAWSQTTQGGKQLPLLRDEPNGCVRWGMCEGHNEPEDAA